MSRIAISTELKKALAALSHQEKDKLILRILPFKPDLVKQLEFKLLEAGETLELRREVLKSQIQKMVKDACNSFYSPGYLLLDMREMSGLINQHVKTTKDKLGEIELNLFMLTETLDRCGEKLSGFSPEKSLTLNQYIIQRADKLLKLLAKLHEDYYLDFRKDFNKLGNQIGKNHHMMKTAIRNGFDVNGLLKI